LQALPRVKQKIIGQRQLAPELFRPFAAQIIKDARELGSDGFSQSFRGILRRE
jgi:hypothetical protein